MSRSRRQFLNDMLVVTGGILGAACLPRAADAAAAWPGPEAWAALRARVGSRLIQPTSPLAPVAADPQGATAAAALKNLQNPFYNEDQPGATQTTGWLDAWSARVSPYAVAAESTADVVAAVDFARKHKVRLVVKGTGHDYLGRSNAPDSLLIWTHPMRGIEFHEQFHGHGPAFSVQAGARWLEVYTAASARNLYVQGGGCTSVGAAGGFIQGSGFGSFSKTFGTGAAGVLEFEVVTADGRVRIANDKQHPDLFWALRGGGGSTFGVVTRVTLRCHPIPSRVGLVLGTIKAKRDDAYKQLIRRFVELYAQNLGNPHWGEQVKFGDDNTASFSMTFLDLTEAEARRAWAPLLDHLAADDFTHEMTFMEAPFRSLWDPDYWTKREPAFIVRDPRPGQRPNQYWWASNQAEVSAFLRTYQSRWIPRALFDEPERLAGILFEASRHWRFTLHFNKGLAGATQDALARTRATPLHPAAFGAAALAISASAQQYAWPGLAGHEPDVGEGRAAVDKVNAVMKILRDATPGGGAYANEADFFEPDWQQSFWGEHYPRLLEIKRRYDPSNLFNVHHGVGSET